MTKLPTELQELIDQNKAWQCICSGWFNYPDYYVTDGNRVWSIRLDRWLTVNRGNGGYPMVWLTDAGENWKLAWLVIGVTQGARPFEGACCLHKDDNKENNRPDNLYWGTRGENIQDALRNGGMLTGEHSLRAKLTNEQAIAIYEAYHAGEETVTELAQKYQISEWSIKDLVRCKTWQHITKEVAV